MKVIRTNFLRVLNFGQVEGPDVKTENHPLGGFFKIILKVDLEISQLLERPSCEIFFIFF